VLRRIRRADQHPNLLLRLLGLASRPRPRLFLLLPHRLPLLVVNQGRQPPSTRSYSSSCCNTCSYKGRMGSKGSSGRAIHLRRRKAVETDNGGEKGPGQSHNLMSSPGYGE
jgi:hypothetical protein